MAPQARSRFSDQRYLDLQSRLLVTARHADIAAKIECHTSKVSQYSNGTVHVPAYRAFLISAAQGDWRFLQFLAEHTGALLMPRQSLLVLLRPMQLLSELINNFGKVMMLAEKTLLEDEDMTDEQFRACEEAWERMKQIGDEILERQRQKRAQKNKE